jgi:hypothetical protein
MPTTTSNPAESIDESAVQHYARRGHWGYILDYRKAHGGKDPDPQKLEEIVNAAEAQKRNLPMRIAAGILEILR